MLVFFFGAVESWAASEVINAMANKSVNNFFILSGMIVKCILPGVNERLKNKGLAN